MGVEQPSSPPPGADPVRARRHLVHFYTDERDLAQTVGRYVAETLRAGGITLGAATPGHVRAIDSELWRAGIDVAAKRAAGSYVTCDAKHYVRQIVVDGRLDPGRSDAANTQMIAQISAGRAPGLAYGEISPTLWEDGLIDAALEFEARTDNLVAEADMTLVCFYRRTRSLCDPSNLEAVRQLCGHHAYLTSLPLTA